MQNDTQALDRERTKNQLLNEEKAKMQGELQSVKEELALYKKQAEQAS